MIYTYTYDDEDEAEYLAVINILAPSNGHVSSNGHGPTIAQQAAVFLNEQEAEKRFWERPVHKHIQTAARAKMMAPWGVLYASLVRVIAAVGPDVVLPAIRGGPASLNLYATIVAPSSVGKNGSRSVSEMSLHIENPAQTLKLGSGEGIAGSYMRPVKGKKPEQYETRVLFLVDEIDALAAVKGRGGSTLMPELRTAWFGSHLGFAYRSAEARLPMDEHAYRLCLLAGSQPNKARALLEKDEIDGGTPQRFIWTDLVDMAATSERPMMPNPRLWRHPTEYIANQFGKYIIQLPAEVTAIVEYEALSCLHGNDPGLLGHRTMCRIKVAAAIAILDQRWHVTQEDWEFAEVVMRHSDAVRERTVKTLVVEAVKENEQRGRTQAARDDTAEESSAQRLANKIISGWGGDGWVTKREISRSLSSRDRGLLNAALAILVQDGFLEKGTYTTQKNLQSIHYRKPKES